MLLKILNGKVKKNTNEQHQGLGNRELSKKKMFAMTVVPVYNTRYFLSALW